MFNKNNINIKQLILCLAILIANNNSYAGIIELYDLKIENKVNPNNIDILKPHFSWKIKSSLSNVNQVAFQILVSDDSLLLKKNIGNIWDSKMVFSNQSVLNEYAGAKLTSAKKYFWKVNILHNKFSISIHSGIAFWQMGLLSDNDWGNAKWIAYDEINDTAIIAPHAHLNGKKAWGPRRNVLPQFRKSITINKKIKSATTFICGLGHFDFFINGKKIGNHFLDPGWTDYSTEAQYISFDITKYLQQGENVLGAMLGNGFFYIPGQRYRKMTGAYGLPKMICKTIIEYTDGTVDEIVSNSTWKTTPSPIIFSSIFGGEDYDANLYNKNWCNVTTNLSSYKNAIEVKPIPHLITAVQEPIVIKQSFDVKNKIQLSSNTTVYDFGQNFSGIPAITVKGSKGDTIKLFCAELLNDDKSVNQKATGSPSYFSYILSGNQTEQWQPQFSYTGFRYVQAICIAKDSMLPLPVLQNITGLHIRNQADSIGNFSCSNELFNKTYDLINWAIKSNNVSLFTDCPHREKLGWLEQTYLMGVSAQYNFDISNLCKKMIHDMQTAQYDNGKIPEIVPEYVKFTSPFDDSPEWGSAAIILPWYNYKWYNDLQTLKDVYPMMQKYIAYLNSKSNNNILMYGLSDWYDIGKNKSGFSQLTRMGVTATATYYYDLLLIKNVASVLKLYNDTLEYNQLAAKVKKSFNDVFFDDNKVNVDTLSQTEYAMALYLGILNDDKKAKVLNALINDIKKRNYALTAGDIGYRYVLKVLEDNNQHEVIYKMNCNDNVPGYGFQLKHGATALTESWQAYPSVSNNHFMLGHLMEWFYSGLVGINQTSNSVGYKNILIQPSFIDSINFAKANFNSPYGNIFCNWQRLGNSITLQVEIPPNTSATIITNNYTAIKINSKLLSKKTNSILIPSGKYNIELLKNK